MRIVARGLLAGVCLVMAASVWAATEPAKPESGQAAPPAPVVRYADDKLSVEAKGADPAVVLQAIARASGAELVGAPRGGQPLTVAFSDIPVKDALERLVGAQNFTLKYTENGKLKAIELRGGQEAAPPPTRPADDKPTAEGNTTPAKWRAFYKAFFDRPEMIPLSPDLQKALERDEAGWDYLGNTAIGHPDARVRSSAMRTLMAAIEKDPQRKDAVLGSLEAMSNEEIAEFARKTAYYRAEDLVRNTLRTTSDPELRSRARGVLHDLRRNPYQGPYTPMH